MEQLWSNVEASLRRMHKLVKFVCYWRLQAKRVSVKAYTAVNKDSSRRPLIQTGSEEITFAVSIEEQVWRNAEATLKQFWSSFEATIKQMWINL